MSEQDDAYGYYTVTCDYFATGEGLTRMIMIGFFKNQMEALSKFSKRFGEFYSVGAEAKFGLEVDKNHLDLLTDYAKKIIIDIKSNNNEAPMFGYENSVYVNYS